MLSRKKQELARKIYKEHHPRAADHFSLCRRYYRSKNPDFYAKTEEALLERLYDFYFSQTLSSIFYRWLADYSTRGIWDPKTTKEHERNWRLHIRPELGDKNITQINKADIKRLYQIWTGRGKITRKAFSNYKSTLNGIFAYASDIEIIPFNIVHEVSSKDLRFKAPVKRHKAYTLDQRAKLIAYLDRIPEAERDGYYYAIKLALYMPLRFGEISGIQYSQVSSANQSLVITQQLRIRQDTIVDAKNKQITSVPRKAVVKDPKGNPEYSIREIPLTKSAMAVLKEARSRAPFEQYLFTKDGRLLNNDTFNDHLKKFETQAGLPYLSSHKMRFTVASILYNGGHGMDVNDLRKILGHSTVSTTLHYVEAYTGNEEEIRSRTAAEMERFLENMGQKTS